MIKCILYLKKGQNIVVKKGQNIIGVQKQNFNKQKYLSRWIDPDMSSFVEYRAQSSRYNSNRKRHCNSCLFHCSCLKTCLQNKISALGFTVKGAQYFQNTNEQHGSVPHFSCDKKWHCNNTIIEGKVGGN